MKLETAQRLHDAAGACRELQHVCAEHSRNQFMADRLVQLAVWKLIEIVGEALHQAERLEPAVAQRIPDLRDIIDTRNRITHGYDSVSFALLWDIVQDEITPLLLALDVLLLDAPDIRDSF